MSIKLEKVITQKRSLFTRIAQLFFSLSLALILGALFMTALGVDPLTTYLTMFSGAFGSTYSLTETLAKATPLSFLALAVLLPSLAQFWNVGAEGQYAMGAFAGSGVRSFLVLVATHPLTNSGNALVCLFGGSLLGSNSGSVKNGL